MKQLVEALIAFKIYEYIADAILGMILLIGIAVFFLIKFIRSKKGDSANAKDYKKR